MFFRSLPSTVPRLLVGALLGLGSSAVDAQHQSGRSAAHHRAAERSHLVIPQVRSYAPGVGAPGVKLVSVRARVAIVEGAATTTLEVALHNGTRRPEEARLLLPVPAGAAVTSLLFEGGAAEGSARLLPLAEARRIYDSIVRKKRDPALLEFAGYRLIRSSVFPVAPGGGQKVRITYHEILETDGPRVDYLLPRSESLAEVCPWRVEVDVSSAAAIVAAYSPTHEISVRRTGRGRLRVEAGSDTGLEPGPLRLSLLREEKGLTASLLAYPDPSIGGGYFLLLAGMPEPGGGEARPLPREVTLVLDRSGSMAGAKLEQAKRAVVQVIEGLDEGERFNIIDYATSVGRFRKKPVLRTPRALKAARRYLERLRPGGGTNIHDALLEALRQRFAAGRLPMVLFITDGIPTIGRTEELAIGSLADSANPHRRRVFTLGVGSDVNVPLLDRIAETSGGRSSALLPGEPIEPRVSALLSRLGAPVLTGAELVALDGNGDVTTTAIREPIPATLPDLFEGEPLVLLGQYLDEGSLIFELTGDLYGRPHTVRLSFDLDRATVRNAFVARLWARRRIATLAAELRQTGARPRALTALSSSGTFRDPRLRELTDEILRLSMEHGVLSEYTAFLAREGTDLSHWEGLRRSCSAELHEKAIRKRSGVAAVNQGL
ncbi:MAG: VWA domain-containing protein, partial [Planctomycetota bacterium]